jgi:hypothetical protein
MRPGGVANDFEADLEKLKRLAGRVPGKPYGHRCLWVQGKQRFRCIVEDVEIPVELLSRSGGAMTVAPNYATLTLKEIRR